jgi:hypothetical protein
VFFAVELESNDVSQDSPVGELHEMRTSLTGIEETPTSIAMNQHALVKKVSDTTQFRQHPGAKKYHRKSRPLPITLSGKG